MIADSGTLPSTTIATGSPGLEDTSDSSARPSKRPARSNSAPSPQSLPSNSNSELEVDGTGNQGPTLSLLGFLLSQLQSQLAEIKHRGGVGVRMFQRNDGLAVLLPDVRLCDQHQILHDGAAGCPLPH